MENKETAQMVRARGLALALVAATCTDEGAAMLAGDREALCSVASTIYEFLGEAEEPSRIEDDENGVMGMTCTLDNVELGLLRDAVTQQIENVEKHNRIVVHDKLPVEPLHKLLRRLDPDADVLL